MTEISREVVFDPFVTLTMLTFDRVQMFGGHNHVQEKIPSIMVLILCGSVQNWLSYDEKYVLIRKVETPTTFDPQPLTRVLTPVPSVAYHKIGYKIPHILALVSSRSYKIWPIYCEKSFLTFSWPWPWPLTRSLPKSNRLVLGLCPIIPQNFMKFGWVVFELFCTHTHTHTHTNK